MRGLGAQSFRSVRVPELRGTIRLSVVEAEEAALVSSLVDVVVVIQLVDELVETVVGTVATADHEPPWCGAGAELEQDHPLSVRWM